MLSSLKSLAIRVKVVALQYENPPSLFTMLKSAGHFILLWQVTQRPTHRQVNWWHCCNRVVSMLRM